MVAWNRFIITKSKFQTSILLLWTFFNMTLQSLQGEFSASGNADSLKIMLRKFFFAGRGGGIKNHVCFFNLK